MRLRKADRRVGSESAADIDRTMFRWAILVPLGLASFITSLDNTVVNVALPRIGKELELGTLGLEWVVVSYLLTFSALLLAAGRIADRLGHRRVLVLGLSGFGMASLFAGAANSGDLLIAARAVQGCAAAFVLPATLAIIATEVPAAYRNRATAVWTAAIALALAVGPVVGGTVTQYLNWSWIFYLNVPCVVVAVVTAYWFCADLRGDAAARAPIDVRGVVSSALALACATYALIEMNEQHPRGAMLVAAAAGATVSAAAFVRSERRAVAPMLDRALFRQRIFNGAIVGQLLWGLAMNGAFFFTSLFLQDVLRYSPSRAGLTFLPLALLLIALVPLADAAVKRFGGHRLGAAGLLVVAAGLVLLTRVQGDASYLRVLPGLLLIGAGSACTAPLTTEILAVSPRGKEGVASAIMGLAREVAGVLGVAIVGAIVVSRQSSGLQHGVACDIAYTQGYHRGMAFAAVVMVVAALVTYLTLRPTVAAPAAVEAGLS